MGRSTSSATVDPADADLLKVVNAVAEIPWTKYPGGWPGQIELALIDAVFSIQARYGGPETGVRRVLSNYKTSQVPRRVLDDLPVLAAAESESLKDALGNLQRASRRLKSDLVIEAARALVGVGVVGSKQFDVHDSDQRRAYCGVFGLGWVTFEYLGMNLGQQGVKADIHIQRFVTDAVGRVVTDVEAGQLVKAAARHLKVGEIQLDYAVWSEMSGKPRRRI